MSVPKEGKTNPVRFGTRYSAKADPNQQPMSGVGGKIQKMAKHGKMEESRKIDSSGRFRLWQLPTGAPPTCRPCA